MRFEFINPRYFDYDTVEDDPQTNVLTIQQSADETIIGQYKDDTNDNVFILRILDHTKTRDELNPYLDVYLSEDDLNKIRQIINVGLKGGAKE